jgi:acyl-[acyl-carrier-protein] desaturase
MAETLSDEQILHELEPTAETLLNRHLDSSEEWFPHQLVPYDRGRTFTPGQQWTEADTDLGGNNITDAVRSSLLVNLLTEDNLPYYFRSIESTFGADGAWGNWARRWTAEEGRHSMVIYNYLMVTQAIDPVVLERARMIQVGTGVTPRPEDVLHTNAYLAMQELATRVAHRNTGKMLGDGAGYDVMMRVAADENRHHLFYRDLLKAAFQLAPSQTLIAVSDVARTFDMPGIGIPDFEKHTGKIALAGIYGINEFKTNVLENLLKQWKVDELENLTPEAERARMALHRRLGALGKLAAKETEVRQQLAAA